MNILMFTDVYKPVINGVTFSLDFMAKQLREQGHHVTIISPEYPNSTNETDNVRLPSLNFSLFHGQRILIPFGFKKILNTSAKKWDRVHIHTPFNAGFLGIWFAKKNNIPTVFSYHTYFEKYSHYIPVPAAFFRMVIKFWSKHLCNACDHVIAPSPEIQAVLRSYHVYKPIHILPTEISLPLVTAEKTSPYTEELHLPDNAKVCLYVGRLAQEKNLTFMLDAFKLSKEHVPDAHLVIIGDGPSRQHLEKYTRQLNIQHAVTFLGARPRNDLPNWYHHATVFLCASQTETQGLTVYEALHFGLPPVIIDGPGTRNAVINGVNGYVSPLDICAFAKCITRLLSSEELRNQFSRHAVAQKKFLRANTFAQRLLEIYCQSSEPHYQLDYSNTDC